MQMKVRLLLCKHCLWCHHFSRKYISTTTITKSSGNYYDLLGVKKDATVEEIKRAFFARSKELHPDSDPSNPGLHKQFVELSEAYQVLSKDVTRKTYDARMRVNAFKYSTTDAYTYHDWQTPSKNTQSENMHYWGQFRNTSNEDISPKAKRQRNQRLVGYCILIMLGGILAHYMGFQKLEEIHSSFMNEKDKIITKIYNESKERARVNGFQKQQEILRKKHTEFIEKYQRRRSKDE
ncbi:dnaJ homolog subfamily C member 4 [Polypterus senegalus]|uniref:dnaJ homolog subfamily C member 4 n=1 Tax=Polypterus senegalus TaxID=55291 RepID=UPI001965E43C|nr:dnaJ homolog subfamily C member 4 [Polypterus senegalus]